MRNWKKYKKMWRNFIKRYHRLSFRFIPVLSYAILHFQLILFLCGIRLYHILFRLTTANPDSLCGRWKTETVYIWIREIFLSIPWKPVRILYLLFQTIGIRDLVFILICQKPLEIHLTCWKTVLFLKPYCLKNFAKTIVLSFLPEMNRRKVSFLHFMTSLKRLRFHTRKSKF